MSPISFIATIRNSFIGAEHIYTHGSCYYFYLILADVFLNAAPYTFNDHVIVRIDNKFYDITGEVDGEFYQPYDFKIHDLHKRPFSLWDCGLECPSCDEIVLYGEIPKETP